MMITIALDSARIADLMVTAIEGGISYWCRAVKLIDASKYTMVGAVQAGYQKYEPVENPWYSDPGLYDCDDFTIEVHEIEDESPGAPDKVITITREAFIDGLQRFARTSHFGDFQAENEDATTGDVFLQMLALGEVVYG